MCLQRTTYVFDIPLEEERVGYKLISPSGDGPFYAKNISFSDWNIDDSNKRILDNTCNNYYPSGFHIWTDLSCIEDVKFTKSKYYDLYKVIFTDIVAVGVSGVMFRHARGLHKEYLWPSLQNCVVVKKFKILEKLDNVSI